MTKKIPQRVSIKYSVDLGEVPERVAIMLTELANSFSGISKHARDTSTAARELQLKECLTGLRDVERILEKAKIRVQDLSEIMLGYINILNDAVENTQQEATESSAPKKKTSKKKTTKKQEKKEAEDETSSEA